MINAIKWIIYYYMNATYIICPRCGAELEETQMSNLLPVKICDSCHVEEKILLKKGMELSPLNWYICNNSNFINADTCNQEM